MKYKYVISTLCIFGTMSLYSEEKDLGDILQQAGHKEALIKPGEQKSKKSKKESRFVFKDEYHSNGIGSQDKSNVKNKSESYDYNNKSKFKFKFNNGSSHSNLVGAYGSGSGMGGSMGGSMGGAHGGGGGKR